MKYALIFACLYIASCAPRPIEDANPLDRPQDLKNAWALHDENAQAITGNPAYRINRPTK